MVGAASLVIGDYLSVAQLEHDIKTWIKTAVETLGSLARNCSRIVEAGR
ncbi:MAG: hypothetical protein ACYDD6_04225 [Acidimicrobiales bacterium]